MRAVVQHVAGLDSCDFSILIRNQDGVLAIVVEETIADRAVFFHIQIDEFGNPPSVRALKNAGQCPSSSSPYDVNSDGSICVGLSWDGCSGRGFWYSEATGMLELQVLGSGGKLLVSFTSMIDQFCQANESGASADRIAEAEAAQVHAEDRDAVDLTERVEGVGGGCVAGDDDRLDVP